MEFVGMSVGGIQCGSVSRYGKEDDMREFATKSNQFSISMYFGRRDPSRPLSPSARI